jgi:predicted house-cleaning noncanonical NTP pyrophosphatase (MazG superfamily)
MDKTDLDYVIEKLKSGTFVLKRIAERTHITEQTLLRIRDEKTKSPGGLTVKALRDYFMKAGE